MCRDTHTWLLVTLVLSGMDVSPCLNYDIMVSPSIITLYYVGSDILALWSGGIQLLWIPFSTVMKTMG